MDRDAATTDRLRNLISRIESLTEKGELHWERQVGSAHRFARWNNNLLILGPAAPLSEMSVPRYLMITPFDSPDCIEINSDDAELGGWQRGHRAGNPHAKPQVRSRLQIQPRGDRLRHDDGR